MKKLWGSVGMTDVETTTFDVERSFKSFEEYWAISSLGPSVIGALNELSSEVVDGIKSKLNKTLERDKDNKIVSIDRKTLVLDTSYFALILARC